MVSNSDEIKRVLIVSYLFPPANNIGAVRISKFAKYLPQFGWEPFVLTVSHIRELPQNLPIEMADANIFRTHGSVLVHSLYRGLEGVGVSSANLPSKRAGWKLLSRNLLKLASPVYNQSVLRPLLWDPIGWYPHGVRKGIDIINKFNIDVIFSSFSPSTSHLIAARLQRISGLPWIGDFRDHWSMNPNAKRMIGLGFIEQQLEKKVMKKSTTLTTASEPIADQLSVLHSKKVVTIHNGFDEEDYTGEAVPTAKFTITYTGRMYPGKQDPSPLFEAVRDLWREGMISVNDFEVRFLGSNVIEILMPMVHQYGIEELVNLYSTVPFKESISKQMESSVLLLLKWNDAAVKGYYFGKTFEYLGARRPILAIGKFADEFVDQLLMNSGTGIVLRDTGEVKACLTRWIEEFKHDGGIKTNFDPNTNVITRYTRKRQAAMLAQLFSDITLKNKTDILH